MQKFDKNQQFCWFCLRRFQSFSTTCWSQGSTYITTVLMATLRVAERLVWNIGSSERNNLPEVLWIQHVPLMAIDFQRKHKEQIWIKQTSMDFFLKLTPEFHQNSLGIVWLQFISHFIEKHCFETGCHMSRWSVEVFHEPMHSGSLERFEEVFKIYHISWYFQYHSIFINELKAFDFRFHPTTARCHLKRKWTL